MLPSSNSTGHAMPAWADIAGPETSFRVKFPQKRRALTIALKRWHDADAFMADIVAKRLVRYLERAGYVVMKRPPLEGHSAIGSGF
jgi:hypothetical protein